MENTEKIVEMNIEATQKASEEVNENPYNLRPLVATDMGAICKIITAVGIRQFKEAFNVEGLDLENLKLETLGIGIGIDIAGIIFSNFPKAENEIQTFLASMTGMKLSEVKAMGLADYGELIMMIVMKEEFKDFFKRVMKLFNR